jgi:hypothetical protein
MNTQVQEENGDALVLTFCAGLSSTESVSAFRGFCEQY